jgi:histidine phosphotransferase ChpT
MSTPEADTLLANLLCSRLCHDLIGPVGAVGNGLEVLADEDDADMRRQALELLTFSAEEASRRLKFYRLAFGAAGGGEVPLSLGEAREAARGLLTGGKVALDWPDAAMQAGVTPNKIAVRLLLNMIQLAAEGLPRGGRVAVQLARSGSGVAMTVVASGPTATLPEALVGALNGRRTLAELDPRAAQAFYARRLAQDCRSQVSVMQSDGQLVLSAAVPS